MERLHIAQTSLTPLVDFDAERGLLKFQGESYPENVLAFYNPVIEWLRRYFSGAGAGPVVMQIALRYMNTSSTKVFMMIFDLCQEALARGCQTSIYWHHHPDDDLIREMGEDLADGLQVPFIFVADQ